VDAVSVAASFRTESVALSTLSGGDTRLSKDIGWLWGMALAGLVLLAVAIAMRP
jgi:hypothetical protein